MDHNSAAYGEAVEALEELEEALRGANDFAEVEEKEQRVAEISAARRLMQSVRVQVKALVGLVKGVAVQFGTKLKDTAIGLAVAKALAALGVIVGYIFNSLTGP